MRFVRFFVLVPSAITIAVDAFHDCVQSRRSSLKRRRRRPGRPSFSSDTSSPCSGGICVGMTDGPHQGGNASYPVAWNGTTGTRLEAFMTVPQYPKALDGITYYIWTDIFFGDESLGRMNQLVPQLLLGSVLDESTGPPDYKPKWHTHATWMFGAHYFFETLNLTTMKTESHAAYGPLFPAYPGEKVYTLFEMILEGTQDDADTTSNKTSYVTDSFFPIWTLTMQVVGDPARMSILPIRHPYMGMGRNGPRPSYSWFEPNFQHLCLNSCWELYGAIDAEHLPTSGAVYNLTITQPKQEHSHAYYDFTTWEQDEGNGICPSCRVEEHHSRDTQQVNIEIQVV
ncbi:hypothetical protein IV203_015668 [Nitzschia inconspicua]|uniref:Uncharacterized protein n=1 Tax=Nitzschia inconspicua TaxID=303405 RepID=A0A9K3LCA6_9STRA|nr:hypothetical protein IV203_015668 [Nitzschia inconspicua]